MCMVKYVSDLYVVKEIYFGKFDDVSVVGYAPSLQDAELLVDALSAYRGDRPFKYEYSRKYSFEEVPFGVFDESVEDIEDMFPNSLLEAIKG